MAVKKRDFQKISQLIQEFLGKLSGEEASAELRDTLNFALLHLQRYYKCLRTRSDSNGLSNSGTFKSLKPSFNGGISPISPICRGGDIFDWKWINLDSPRLVSGMDTEDFTMLKPCLHAAKNADLTQLKEFIEKDSDCINQVDGLGRSALMYAVHGNSDEHYQCTKLLIDCASDVNHVANDGSTSLHIASHDNNSQALQILLEHKAKCNVKDCEGRSPLHWAAANSSTQNIKLLLEHDADIRGCDNNGLTPPMWACHFDQVTNLEILQEAVEKQGSDKDILMDDIDHEGRTLIHWAITRHGELNCLKKLLNPETAMLTDKEGRNVFLTAAKEGSLSACEEVLSVLGEEVLGHVNNKNQTALHIATICAHGGVVDLLLERGADASQEDSLGSSAMDYAQSCQLNYCMLIFLSYQNHQQTLENNQKNGEYNSQDKSEKNSPTNTHQDIAAPSAPPLEEIDINPPAEETDKIIDRVSFDAQEEDKVVEKADHQVPQPSPRHMKQTSTDKKANSISKPSTPRRQQTLTRQSNIPGNQDESGHSDEEFDTHTFDCKMEGEVLILVDDMEDLNAASEIVIDCDNETSPSPSPMLERGRSVSSVHSEQENAENVSVSMDMGVSSIGSDSEDNAADDEVQEQTDDMPFDDKEHKNEITQADNKEEQIPRNDSPSPPQELYEPPVAILPLPSHQKLQPLPMADIKSKKKKDKKKKKQKLAEISAPIPPRGFAAPLEPPPVRMDFPGGHHKAPLRDSYVEDFNELEHRPSNPVPPAHLVELPGGLRGQMDSGRDVYGHMGPPQGPLAFNNGQKLLRNTDFVPPNGTKFLGSKMMPKPTPRAPSLGKQGHHSMPPVPRPPPPR